MVKPILNKPYAPSWHSTDVRLSFALERRRLAAAESDRLDGSLGMALGQALVLCTRSRAEPGASE